MIIDCACVTQVIKENGKLQHIFCNVHQAAFSMVGNLMLINADRKDLPQSMVDKLNTITPLLDTIKTATATLDVQPMVST